MSRLPQRLPIAILCLFALALGVFLRPDRLVSESEHARKQLATRSGPALGGAERELPAPAPQDAPEPHAVEALLTEIFAGAPVIFSVGGSDPSKPIYFRPTTVTDENFRATVGAEHSLEIESQMVFTGRSLLGGERASLAIVNGQLAAHVRQSDGSIRHFRSNPETGEFESILEQAGDRLCEIDPSGEIATTVSRDPLPDDPWSRAEPAAIEPDIAASSGQNPANGNLQFVDRPIPYGRLYDSSLKDILVLVVLDKGATGSDSSNNLASKTANYLSIMSNISAMY